MEPQSLLSSAPPRSPSLPLSAADANEIYVAICAQIIREQTLIMGTLALEQAGHVTGLVFDPTTRLCSITGAGTEVVEQLVNQYRDFFGKAAVEVCKEAAARFTSRLPPGEIPASLL